MVFVEGLPAWTGRSGESAFVEVASSFDDYVAKLKIQVDSIIELLQKPSLTDENRAAIREYLDIGMSDWRAHPKLAELLP